MSTNKIVSNSSPSRIIQYSLTLVIALLATYQKVSAQATDCSAKIIASECASIEKRPLTKDSDDGSVQINFPRWNKDQFGVLDKYGQTPEAVSQLKKAASFKAIDKEANKISKNLIKLKRHRELYNFAKNTLLDQLNDLPKSAGQAEAIKRLKNATLVNLSEATAKKALGDKDFKAFSEFCDLQGFGAYSYPLKNMVVFCPWANLLSEDEIVSTLGHELSHSYDPCNISKNECQFIKSQEDGLVPGGLFCPDLSSVKRNFNPKTCANPSSLKRKEVLLPYPSLARCLNDAYLPPSLKCLQTNKDPAANLLTCQYQHSEHFGDIHGRYVLEKAYEKNVVKFKTPVAAVESLLGYVCFAQKTKRQDLPIYPDFQSRLNLQLSTKQAQSALKCSTSNTKCRVLDDERTGATSSGSSPTSR